MKHSILLFLLAVCIVPKSNGQKLTIKRDDHGSHTVEYSSRNRNHDRTSFYLSGETKAGIGISAGGIIVGGVGIGLYNAYSGKNENTVNSDRYRQIGVGMWLVGGVIGILGSVFAIDGSIRDYHAYSRQEYFSLISNKPNEVGLAFNFR